jgi:hypothetical protein
MTTPRFVEFVVRNIVAGAPLAVVVAEHEVAFGNPPGVKKSGFR